VLAAGFALSLTAFKQNKDLYVKSNNPFLFNLAPTLDHFRFLFNDTNFLTFVRNTMVMGLAVVVITLLISLPAAYSLARLARKWGERLGIGIFLVYLIPSTLLFIPMQRVIVFLGLQESLWSLILVYPTELIRGDVFFWQSLQAAAIVVAVPIALVFNLFLDKFVSGFTMGAVKG